MSTDYLKIIPSSPEYVPSKKAQKLAIALLESFFPDGEEFEAEVYDEVTFIDQGENIEAVLCPSCKARLDLHPSKEKERNIVWWHELSDALCENPIDDLSTKMPCCKKKVLAIDLEFDWPAGFARFELSVMNPNVKSNLPQSKLRKLEEIIGCSLRQVRAHY